MATAAFALGAPLQLRGAAHAVLPHAAPEGIFLNVAPSREARAGACASARPASRFSYSPDVTQSVFRGAGQSGVSVGASQRSSWLGASLQRTQQRPKTRADGPSQRHAASCSQDGLSNDLRAPLTDLASSPNGVAAATPSAARPGINPWYEPEGAQSEETKKMLEDYLLRILRAKVYDVAIESPLELAPTLSARSGNRIMLKREDMQQVFSFKLRGAFNKMANLTEVERAVGIVACSAGNHAQGVALAAKTLGCQATIVMPQTTPEIKVAAVKRLGGRVVLSGESYDGAAAYAAQLQKDEGLTFVHPFDDPDTIAGQGTVGMEILRQGRALRSDPRPEPRPSHPPGPSSNEAPHAIFVPVGGGGLVAGIAAYVKAVHPQVKVIGVEPTDSNCMQASLAAGERVLLDQVGLFADGVAVKLCGEHTFNVSKPLVDEIVLVDTDEMCAAIKDVFADTRSILEPAGSLGVAGAKKYAKLTGCKNELLVAVTSGANMNFDVLRYVSERSELGEKREAVLAVTIPERPGAFKEFCGVLGTRNITEFNYRYSSADRANVFVGIQPWPSRPIKDRTEVDATLADLQAAGLDALDLTDNEMAKLHVRHMVGGRAVPTAEQSLFPKEIVFRFEFPERPGALLRFLNELPPVFNISMFHYRNHGADVGRVLCGIQVPEHQMERFHNFLDSIGYRYFDETENPAYRYFLR
eukprot:tig00020510_g9838.t1